MVRISTRYKDRENTCMKVKGIGSFTEKFGENKKYIFLFFSNKSSVVQNSACPKKKLSPHLSKILTYVLDYHLF